MRLLVCALAIFLLTAPVFAGWMDIACVGDSITYGYGVAKGWDYPSQLQRMIATKGVDVYNFGVNGATLLRNGDRPYVNQPAYKKALGTSSVSEVIIMLGANDTKSWNWGPHHNDFEADYRWLIGQFQAGSPQPRIWLCRPCWVSGTNKFGITEAGIELEIPIIDAIAQDLHLKEIDLHAVLEGHPEYYKDTVHPTADGDTLLAKAVYKAVMGQEYQGKVPPPAPASTQSPTPWRYFATPGTGL